MAHALLAALPHEAAVTTNSDLCYDAACAAAGVSVNLLAPNLALALALALTLTLALRLTLTLT